MTRTISININTTKSLFKVSYNFIYNTLTKEGILSPKARKRTKKEFIKKQLLKEKKINLKIFRFSIDI